MARLMDEERGRAALPSKDDEEAFRTPTSEESKLPSVAPSCPPAPRKTRRRALQCKRKLWAGPESVAVVEGQLLGKKRRVSITAD
ncbi:hypothetical protein OPV22_021279 [Ensete ventricosum]|nr:hypothetical protein OPV22_021279 [Ensete ventricosum]